MRDDLSNSLAPAVTPFAVFHHMFEYESGKVGKGKNYKKSEEKEKRFKEKRKELNVK